MASIAGIKTSMSGTTSEGRGRKAGIARLSNGVRMRNTGREYRSVTSAFPFIVPVLSYKLL
jgi:hypothetical protein